MAAGEGCVAFAEPERGRAKCDMHDVRDYLEGVAINCQPLEIKGGLYVRGNLEKTNLPQNFLHEASVDIIILLVNVEVPIFKEIFKYRCLVVMLLFIFN